MKNIIPVVIKLYLTGFKSNNIIKEGEPVFISQNSKIEISNKNNFEGIFGYIPFSFEPCVYQKGIFYLNKKCFCDKVRKLKTNSPLYISKNGDITTSKKYSNNLKIGKIIENPEECHCDQNNNKETYLKIKLIGEKFLEKEREVVEEKVVFDRNKTISDCLKRIGDI